MGQGAPVPLEQIYPMPAPETIGLTLAPDAMARVSGVVPGSPAAAAGLQPGDEIRTCRGQPLISIADFAWALHRAPEAGPIPVGVARGGRELELSVVLPEGWRSRTDISRRVGTWSMRAMALGGLVLTDLDDAARRGGPTESMPRGAQTRRRRGGTQTGGAGAPPYASVYERL